MSFLQMTEARIGSGPFVPLVCEEKLVSLKTRPKGSSAFLHPLVDRFQHHRVFALGPLRVQPNGKVEVGKRQLFRPFLQCYARSPR